jgi:CRP-like cAMP-binding protein
MFERGQLIFNSGESATSFFIILHGLVLLLSTGEDGRLDPRVTLGKGKGIGERGIIR